MVEVAPVNQVGANTPRFAEHGDKNLSAADTKLTFADSIFMRLIFHPGGSKKDAANITFDEATTTDAAPWARAITSQ